jgi:hypothetical protein
MQYEEIKKYVGKDLYFIDKEDKRFPIKRAMIDYNENVRDIEHNVVFRISGKYISGTLEKSDFHNLFESLNEAKFKYFWRLLCDKSVGRVGCCVVDGLRLKTDCFIDCIDSQRNGAGFIDATMTVIEPECFNRPSVQKENIENVFPTKEMAQKYIDEKCSIQMACYANSLFSITKKLDDTNQEWKNNTLEPINDRTIKSLVYGDEIFLIDPSSLDRIAVFQCPILSDTLLAIKEKLSFAYWNLNAVQKTLEEIKRKKTLSDFKASTKRIFKEETDLLRNGDVYYYFNNLGEILSKTFCDSKGLDSLTDERILTIDGGYWTKNGAQLALIEAIRKGRIN